MNFLGHFSTNEEERNGNFSMLVAADSIENAVEKFEKQILETKETGDMLTNVNQVYLDVIIQINTMPLTPQVTRYESRRNDGIASLCIDPVDHDQLEAFYWRPDDKDEEDIGEDEEIFPFVDFKK